MCEADAGTVEARSLDLAGYQLRNAENAAQVATIPSGTVMLPGDVLVIARDTTRAEFETEWGVALASSVPYFSTGAGNSGAPIINGGDRWSVVRPDGVVVDGPTLAGEAGHSYRRIAGDDPALATSGLDAAHTEASPGTTLSSPARLGLVISGWSDRSGNGRYVFEFVELWYDP